MPKCRKPMLSDDVEAAVGARARAVRRALSRRETRLAELLCLPLPIATQNRGSATHPAKSTRKADAQVLTPRCAVVALPGSTCTLGERSPCAASQC